MTYQIRRQVDGARARCWGANLGMLLLGITLSITGWAVLATKGSADDSSASAAIESLTDDDVESLLKELNISEVGRNPIENGETLFKLQAHQRQIGVVHNAQYKQLQFVALYSDGQDITVEKVRQANRWNRTQRLSRVAILKEGAWGVTRDLNYRHTSTHEAIGSALREFVAELPGFRTFVEEGKTPAARNAAIADNPISLEHVEQALQKAGADAVDLIEADETMLKFSARFGPTSITVELDRRASILSLQLTHRSQSMSMEDVLRHCNTWNDQPSLGRASAVDASASDESLVLWQLNDDMALTKGTPQSALLGFITEFASNCVIYREFAAGTRTEAPDLASRFGSTAPATPAKPTGPAIDEAVAKLWIGVVDFRRMAVVDGNAAWEKYAVPSLNKEVSDLGKTLWAGQPDEGWSYFFSLALFDMGRPQSDRAVVGFYHPWTDVWLLTEWSIDPEPRIVSTEMLSGEWVRQRGKPPFNPRPDWLRREGFRVEQLARATIANINALDRVMFSDEPWREALGLAAADDSPVRIVNRDIVGVNLLNGWMRQLEVTDGEDDPKQPMLARVSKAADRFRLAGEQGTMGELLKAAHGTEERTAKIIASLPGEVYRFLPSVYWIADEKRGMVFLVPITNPDYCLALTIDLTTLENTIERVDLFSFPAAYKLVTESQTRKAKVTP